MKINLTPVNAPAIKSRPVYASLTPRSGGRHLIIADGEGAVAVTDMLDHTNDRSEILAAAHVMYAPGPNGSDLSARLQGLGAAQFFGSNRFGADTNTAGFG